MASSRWPQLGSIVAISKMITAQIKSPVAVISSYSTAGRTTWTYMLNDTEDPWRIASDKPAPAAIHRKSAERHSLL